MNLWDATARVLEAPLVVREPLRALDAIVVLGAPLVSGAAPSAVLVERARAAAALYHAGGAPLVVATGGVTQGASPAKGARAEADVLAELLAAAGVPDVVVERVSRTTAENARYTAALVAPRGVRRVWVVTQPFHGRRAVRLFRTAGLEAFAWHIADSLEYRDRRKAVRWLVREYAAWLGLFARGR
ncbi:MAG TPA: YdcF family protein [Kofleriaceae bacterium]|nr:YdcF family protein [Kofleriaceae bacterium]